MDKDSHEIRRKYEEAFKTCGTEKFSLEQLETCIVFVLSFPDGSEKETRIDSIPNTSHLSGLFIQIKEIFPNRSNYCTKIKFNKGIYGIGENGKYLMKVEEVIYDEMSPNNQNENIFLSFLEHQSFDTESIQQTLKLEVSFDLMKSALFYFITKDPISERDIQSRNRKIEMYYKRWKFSIKDFNYYSDNLIQMEESDLLYIFVDINFMNEVVEKEVHRAKSINILADMKNEEANKLKNLHPTKILKISPKIELMINFSSLPQ